MKNIQTTDWDEMWTLEWNEKQKMFHIENANDRFHLNQLDYIDSDNKNHWSMLGVFNSRERAEACRNDITILRTEKQNKSNAQKTLKTAQRK